MQKILNQTQTFMTVIWFCTAIYLNVNYIIDYFVKTDPYIAKTIFVGSSLILFLIMALNKFKNISKKTDNSNNSKNSINLGCRSCKKS
jgi:preprotein translocase subunit SecG